MGREKFFEEFLSISFFFQLFIYIFPMMNPRHVRLMRGKLCETRKFQFIRFFVHDGREILNLSFSSSCWCSGRRNSCRIWMKQIRARSKTGSRKNEQNDSEMLRGIICRLCCWKRAKKSGSMWQDKVQSSWKKQQGLWWHHLLSRIYSHNEKVLSTLP